MPISLFSIQTEVLAFCGSKHVINVVSLFLVIICDWQKHRLYLKRSSGMTLQQNGMPFPNTISGITESNIVFRLFKMRFSGMTLHVYRRVVCYSDSTLDIDDLVLNSFHQFHLFSNEIFRI